MKKTDELTMAMIEYFGGDAKNTAFYKGSCLQPSYRRKRRT